MSFLFLRHFFYSIEFGLQQQTALALKMSHIILYVIVTIIQNIAQD